MDVLVIGYEGRRDHRAEASWGAAAVRDADDLMHGATRLRVPYTDEQAAALEARGALTRLPENIAISLRAPDRPIVVDLSEEFVALANLNEIRPPAGHKATISMAKRRIYVFRNLKAFDSFRAALADKVARRFLYPDGLDDSTLERLVHTGLIVHARSGALNALKVTLAPADKRKLRSQMARATLRSEEETSRFDTLLRAALAVKEQRQKPKKDSYKIRYAEGVAQGGGIDVSNALTFLSSVKRFENHAQAALRDQFSFLTNVPSSRLEQIAVGSAVFHFAPEVEGEPLGDSIARYLSLSMFQDAVDGKVPERIRENVQVLEAVEKIVNPGLNTVVQHQRLTDEEFHHVEQPDVDGAPEPEVVVGQKYSEPLTLLGYQSGLLDDFGKLEITIFPGVRLRVSSKKDRDGREPTGVADLKHRNDFLFRPALFTLVRERIGTDRRRYHLQEVRLLASLKRGGGTITAIPSSVIPDAFVYRLGLSTRESSGQLHTDLGDFDTSAEVSEARAWMRAWQECCYEKEVHDLRLSRLAPVRMPSPPAIARVLLTLLGEEEPLTAPAVWDKIRKNFPRDINVDVWATYSRYKSFLTLEEGALRLTNEGERYARAYELIQRRGHR